MRRPPSIVALVAGIAMLLVTTGVARQDGSSSSPTARVPLGRPPEGALARTSPKTFEVSWDVLIRATGLRESTEGRVRRSDRFLFPVLPLSTWSRCDLPSLRAIVSRNGINDSGAALAVDRSLPDGVAIAALPVGDLSDSVLRFTLIQTVTVWRSELDDAAAMRARWPEQWPEEARAWLAPEWFIESNDPRFAAFVERVSEGKLRHTPVFVAAKLLLRATCNAFRGVDSAGVDIGEGNRVLGLRVVGASAAMEAERGTAVDLVCACVAVLRAAGIPARAVVGVNEAPASAGRAIRTTYIVWGEFFLPGSGWVPFDPAEMRGGNAMNASPERAWSGLGRIKDLNTRVPLAFSLAPRRADSFFLLPPGGWGWTLDFRRSLTPTSFITLQMLSRPTPAEDR